MLPGEFEYLKALAIAAVITVVIVIAIFIISLFL